MKSIDIKDLDNLPGIRLKDNDTFSFQCHDKLACFNRCCRNLNLFLYPYDVLRLKKKLNISSDEFLDKYVDVVLRPSEYFPEVLLRMSENSEKTCPFLNESGCSVYPDRPDTCRTFPVEQGTIYDSKTKKTTPIHFFKPPDFCLGKNEKTVWTTKSWAGDQDAVLYNKMTAKWSELRNLLQTDPWQGKGANCSKAKMTFMAAYNIDQFRNFIFNSSFLKRYKVKAVILKKIKTNDLELMKMAFAWIKFFLWGIKTDYLRLRK